MTRKSRTPPDRTASSGLVVGGRGGTGDEMLETGQEEVFSRTEVESGEIEHQSKAGGSSDRGGQARRRPA